jgi:hypothetical protein
MSPLAEKLAAVLADWNELVAALTEAKKQIASREEAIINLQQQYIRQAAEITSLRGQVTTLQQQVQDALLSASDPEDAKLLTRIEAAYAMLSPKGAGKSPAEKTVDTTKAAQLAANLAPPVSAPSDVAGPVKSSSGTAPSSPVSNRPVRAAQPVGSASASHSASGMAPGLGAGSTSAPAAQTPSLRDVVFKLVE